MLNILRKKAQSTVIQVIVLMIAVVFIFWGVGANLGTRRNELAMVNGIEIPMEDFQRTYNTTVDNLRAQFQGNIPQGFFESLNIRDQVLDQLIRAEVLRQGGVEMGLSASPAAVQEKIMEMDVFKENGQFDLNRYKQVLSQNNMNPKSFESGMQNDLLMQRVDEAVRRFAILPDSAVKARHEFANEQVSLAYAAFNSGDFADKVEVDEARLAEWYEGRKKDYLSEPALKLRYMYFGFADDMDKVELSEDMLKKRYDDNIAKYTTPEQRHARHILFRLEETDDAQVREDKKKLAEEVLAMVKAGGDFAELATKYSEGPTAPKGGDLGFFSQGAMVPQFNDVVFSMAPGDTSDIVETVFGYHIIRLEEIREQSVKSFDEVRESLAEVMQQEGVKAVTREGASKAYEDIIRSGSLDKFIENGFGTVTETDYFARSAPPEGPVSDPKFLQSAFGLKKGELSSLVETRDGYAILFVDDIKTPEAPELDAVREKVTADFVKVMSVEMAKAAAEEALKASMEAKKLTVGDAEGVEIMEATLVKRSNPAAAEGVPAQVVQQAFELTAAAPFPKEPFAQGETFYVFQMLEKKLSEEPMDDMQREALTNQLMASQQDRLMTDWFEWLRGRAEIWKNDQLLQ